MSCEYGVRKFYSKGAYLALAWMLLGSIAASTCVQVIDAEKVNYPVWLIAIPLSLFLLIIFYLGLLANSKLQGYTISRIGFITQFIVSILTNCSCLLAVVHDLR